MIAVDTNVLIYAHRAELELHEAAVERLVVLAEGDAQVAALCREHGVSTILTNDRDFERFKPLQADYLS